MKKCKSTRGFLLGVTKDNEKVYLKKASWDCDWYWGFGYVEVYSQHGVHLEHTHFDSLFLKSCEFVEGFKKYFKETTLNNDEIWALLGYMKEFYIMREYAELLQYGNHITSKAKNIIEDKNEEENKKEIYRINKIILPELFEKIYKLLIEEE